MQQSRDELLARTRELMLDAGESGDPVLESALQVILRGSRFNRSVRMLLVAIGQLLVTLVEDCFGPRGGRGDVGERRRPWLNSGNT
jgi:hypothetical protein